MFGKVTKNILMSIPFSHVPCVPLKKRKEKQQTTQNDFSQSCIKLITFITLTSTIYSQNRLWSISAFASNYQIHYLFGTRRGRIICQVSLLVSPLPILDIQLYKTLHVTFLTLTSDRHEEELLPTSTHTCFFNPLRHEAASTNAF